MAEYTFENLIINPETPGLEDLIGKEVYFNDAPIYCIRYANENHKVGILKSVRKEYSAPFFVEIPAGCTLNFACIIPKKEGPKPEYVLFESAKEFVKRYMEVKESVESSLLEGSLLQCGMWIKVKGISDGYCMVTEIWDDGIVLGYSKLCAIQEVSGRYSTVMETTSWDVLYTDFTFLDGSPCGKLTEAV